MLHQDHPPAWRAVKEPLTWNLCTNSSDWLSFWSASRMTSVSLCMITSKGPWSSMGLVRSSWRNQRETFCYNVEDLRLLPLSKVFPSHRWHLHAAFISIHYLNPWEMTFHRLPKNFTQIFTSQQYTSDFMKKQWNCCQASFIQRPICADSPPWASISHFSSLPRSYTYTQKEWANNN